MTSTACPRCNQGEVAPYVLRQTNERVQACDECDAAWPSDVDLAADQHCDLDTFLRTRGLYGQWEELIPASEG